MTRWVSTRHLLSFLTFATPHKGHDRTNSRHLNHPGSPVRAPSAVPPTTLSCPSRSPRSICAAGVAARAGARRHPRPHDYPPPVAKLLGEAVVLAALLGSSLKFEGRFILQTQTDGPVKLLVVDFHAPDRLRAYARFDAARLADGTASRRAARQRPPRHDDRSGPGHEPLPGPRRAGGRQARGRRTRVLSAVGADPDPGPASRWRGVARGEGGPASLARRRDAAAIPAAGAGARAPTRSRSRRRAGRHVRRTRSPKTTPGSKAGR